MRVCRHRPARRAFAVVLPAPSPDTSQGEERIRDCLLVGRLEVRARRVEWTKTEGVRWTRGASIEPHSVTDVYCV